MTDWTKVKEMISSMDDEEALKLETLLHAEIDRRQRKREKKAVKDVVGSLYPREEEST